LHLAWNQNLSYLALGAKVIAAAGSQEKLDICKEYGGADYCINYTKKDWQKEVLKITGGKGVDVVYDPVGLIAGQSVHGQHIVKISPLFDRLS
jgi:NADPH-dependent curcumin reductase CurA